MRAQKELVERRHPIPPLFFLPSSPPPPHGPLFFLLHPFFCHSCPSLSVFTHPFLCVTQPPHIPSPPPVLPYYSCSLASFSPTCSLAIHPSFPLVTHSGQSFVFSAAVKETNDISGGFCPPPPLLTSSPQKSVVCQSRRDGILCSIYRWGAVGGSSGSPSSPPPLT